MRQLGELNRNADKFKEHNFEVIAVFREEKNGTDALKLIKKKTKVDFTLALDTPVEKTAAYSPGNKEFTNYVIDKSGVIRGIIPGDLRNRAKSKELLDIIAKLSDGASSSDGATSDEAAVERAVLDYVEGIYEVKPELIKRGVHPDLQKFGFWRPDGEDDFKSGSAMTFDQLVKLASRLQQERQTSPSRRTQGNQSARRDGQDRNCETERRLGYRLLSSGQRRWPMEDFAGGLAKSVAEVGFVATPIREFAVMGYLSLCVG